MTIAQRVYTGLVIAFGALMVFIFGFFLFTVLPQSSNPDSTKYIMFVFAFHFTSVFITAGMNVLKNRLLVIPTVVQATLLLFTAYGLPVGIWGLVLLRREYMRNKECQQSPGAYSSKAADGLTGNAQE